MLNNSFLRLKKHKLLTCAPSGDEPMSARNDILGIRLLRYNLRKQME